MRGLGIIFMKHIASLELVFKARFSTRSSCSVACLLSPGCQTGTPYSTTGLIYYIVASKHRDQDSLQGRWKCFSVRNMNIRFLSLLIMALTCSGAAPGCLLGGGGGGQNCQKARHCCASNEILRQPWKSRSAGGGGGGGGDSDTFFSDFKFFSKTIHNGVGVLSSWPLSWQANKQQQQNKNKQTKVIGGAFAPCPPPPPPRGATTELVHST